MYDHVIWPERYDPKISPIYALNDVDVKASPEIVWKLLVEATNWSSYFPPEDQVTLPDGATELAMGMRYRRVTIGFPMYPTVEEFEPFRRLAWSTTVEGDDTGSTAYHGWVITPTAEGCHLVSEETQQGPWFLQKLGHEHPGGLYEYHQDWVEGLARAAEAIAAAGSFDPTAPTGQRYEEIRWPDAMRPSRNPIHFTNELEADVSPQAIWSALTDVSLWPAFYPNVSGVTLLDGATTLALGTSFKAGLAGQDVVATVTEYEPFERIAWYGGPKDHPDATAYHAFLFTPTDTGTHLWTEEVMKGDLWIELAKAAPDRFWRDHETLLRDLAEQARRRAGEA